MKKTEGTTKKGILGVEPSFEHRYVTDFGKMKTLVSHCRGLGLKIVLTQGSWDMVHIGHARYLEEAKRHGITAFASVFDPSSVDMLEKLGCPAYKIASMDIVDLSLIKYAAKTGKPLIISTGMASWKEVYDASFAADMGMGPRSAFLHCISGYPASIEES